jgi:hypothetical protein
MYVGAMERLIRTIRLARSQLGAGSKYDRQPQFINTTAQLELQEMLRYVPVSQQMHTLPDAGYPMHLKVSEDIAPTIHCQHSYSDNEATTDRQ